MFHFSSFVLSFLLVFACRAEGHPTTDYQQETMTVNQGNLALLADQVEHQKVEMENMKTNVIDRLITAVELLKNKLLKQEGEAENQKKMFQQQQEKLVDEIGQLEGAISQLESQLELQVTKSTEEQIQQASLLQILNQTAEGAKSNIEDNYKDWQAFKDSTITRLEAIELKEESHYNELKTSNQVLNERVQMNHKRYLLSVKNVNQRIDQLSVKEEKEIPMKKLVDVPKVENFIESCPADIGRLTFCREIMGKSGGCYCFVHKIFPNRYEALAFCKANNMSLYSIETKEEDDAVNKIILQDYQLRPSFHYGGSSSISMHYWTSGSDKDQEGRWYWNDDKSKLFTFTNWCPGQPTNINHHKKPIEHYLIKTHPMTLGRSYWFDIGEQSSDYNKHWSNTYAICEARLTNIQQPI